MTEKSEQGVKTPPIREFAIGIWHLAELIVAFGSLYSLAMHVINKSYLLLSGAARDMTLNEIAAAAPVAAPGLTVTLPDPLATIIITCIVIGILVYVILTYLCEQEWVQEPVQIEKCWEEVTWYNPFSWVTAIVCTFVEVLKWVLKLICDWVPWIVIVLVISCIVIGIIILML